MALDMLKCPMKQEDETVRFKEVLQSLSARSPGEISNLLSQMNEVNKKRVRLLLNTAKIEVTDGSGSTQNVARRIVRVQRRTIPAQQPAQPM